MRRCLRSALSIACLAGLAACNNGELPPDYSPKYVRVPVVTPDDPYRTKYILAPEACLHKDPKAPDKLPPGCANNYNLMQMTEQKRDLTQGRKTGPADAKASVDAAQKYYNRNSDPKAPDQPPNTNMSPPASPAR
jgi:hypothetical protein